MNFVNFLKTRRRPSNCASSARPGLADLSDELLAVIVSNLEDVKEKVVFSEVCRRFHGILFHSKALGSVTLSTDSLGKRAAMGAVRFLLRRMTAVSSIYVRFTHMRKHGLSSFTRFCLPLLLQPMAAEGVQLSLDLYHHEDIGDPFFGADHLFHPDDWGRFAPTLTCLTLDNLASPITAAHMRALCALPHLETLYLGRRYWQLAEASDLTSLDSIIMPKLQAMELQCAQLSTLCFDCPALTSLTLKNCTHLGASSYAGCTQLQQLAVLHSDIAGGNEGAWLEEGLHSLKALKDLDFMGCRGLAVPDSLSSLGSLEKLDLCITWISQLPEQLPMSLREVNLRGNSFACVPNGLYRLSRLEELDLSYQAVADFQLDTSLLPLVSLPQLQFLRLDRSPDFPCWNINSYWHIGEALRAIEVSGNKRLALGYGRSYEEPDDEESASDASEAE